MEKSAAEIWYKLWHDKNGRIVIWQMPNIPLFGWLIFTVASFLFSGKTETVLSYLASLSLFIWAVLELVSGVNYFRRIIGLVFVIVSIAVFIHLL